MNVLRTHRTFTDVFLFMDMPFCFCYKYIENNLKGCTYMGRSTDFIWDMTTEELEQEIERVIKDGKEEELAVLPALKNVLEIKYNGTL